MLLTVGELIDKINSLNLILKKDETYPAVVSILTKLGYTRDVSSDKYSEYPNHSDHTKWEDIVYVVIEYSAMTYYLRDRFEIDNNSICFTDIVLSEKLKKDLIQKF